MPYLVLASARKTSIAAGVGRSRRERQEKLSKSSTNSRFGTGFKGKDFTERETHTPQETFERKGIRVIMAREFQFASVGREERSSWLATADQSPLHAPNITLMPRSSRPTSKWIRFAPPHLSFPTLLIPLDPF